MKHGESFAMEIRYINENDNLLAISNIYEKSWKYTYRNIIPQDYLDSIPAGRWVNKIGGADMNNLALIEKGTIIGTASFCKSRWENYSDYGEIVSIYLLPEYIGKGYGRQRHLRKILTEDYPQWCMPYILKLSSEYVIEIINDIYEYMEIGDNTLFQLFCANNPYMFRYSYSRMASYWNEYYRGCCYKFHNYVGYRLYKQCFGYSKKYDK